MKTNNKVWIYSIVVGLLIINIFHFISIKKLQKRNFKLQVKAGKMIIENDLKNNFIIKQLEFKDIALKSLNKVKIDSILKKENKLLILFNEKVCRSCMMQLTLDLNVLANKIGSDNIIYVADFKNKQLMNDFFPFLRKILKKFY